MRFVLLVLVLLLAHSVLAVSNASVSNFTQEGNYSWNATSISGTQVSGNITHTSLFLNSTTYRWAGISGNVSGNIVLGDAGANALFTWSSSGILVYASEAQPDWNSVVDATKDDVVSSYPFLGEGAPDNYTGTFTGAPEDISSITFSITSDYAPALSNGGTPWKTYSLSDGVNIIFAGRVKAGGDFNYRGRITDFQMILPENGQDTNPTTYNLYVELA
ncbi:hypothetical protein D6789_03100 [Candidatus Woesearchaeota archaeon]|nr:MAG: hypothetical protein D6789_03100 [Candidatus Woesearchaeota archaeon]